MTGSVLVVPTMGTVLSLTLPQPPPPGLRQRVHTLVNDVEGRFSLFRPESEASRVDRGELDIADASPAYRRCHALAEKWSAVTGGAFTPRRPGGGVDLTGIVKALAMDAVAGQLRRRAQTNWCLNVGGDVVVDGVRIGGGGDRRPWVAGIVDPDDRTRLLSQFTLSPRHPAIATSGMGERGEHIRTVGGGGPAEFTQVSVAAPDIVTADVLATAVVAGGTPTLDALTARFDLAVLAVRATGDLVATRHFRAP